MTQQASLDGFEEAPAAPTDRLFFALLPDPRAADKAEHLAHALAAEHGVKLKPGARDKLHITLFHVGDFLGLPQQALAQAREAAGTLKMRPFEVTLERLVSFSGSPRRLPYVLLAEESPALSELQSEMTLRMHRRGLTHGVHHRKFTPHMTLLYGQERLDERPIEPISWTASEFVLIHSLIGRGQYIDLGRWPLA